MPDRRKEFREGLMQALARGYTHERNSDKELDVDLIVAMADEVTAYVVEVIGEVVGVQKDGSVSSRQD